MTFDRTEQIIFGGLVIGGLVLMFKSQTDLKEQGEDPDANQHDKKLRQLREETSQIEHDYEKLMGDFDFQDAKYKGILPRSPPIEDRAYHMSRDCQSLRDRLDTISKSMMDDPSGMVKDAKGRVDHVVMSLEQVLAIAGQEPRATSITEIYTTHNLNHILQQDQRDFNFETKAIMLPPGTFGSFGGFGDSLGNFQRRTIDGAESKADVNMDGFLAIEDGEDQNDETEELSRGGILNPTAVVIPPPKSTKPPEPHGTFVRPSKRKPQLLTGNEGPKAIEYAPVAPHPAQPNASAVALSTVVSNKMPNFNPADDRGIASAAVDETQRFAEELAANSGDQEDSNTLELQKRIADREKIENALVPSGALAPGVNANLHKIDALKIRFDQLVQLQPSVTTKADAESAYRDLTNVNNYLYYSVQTGRYQPKDSEPTLKQMKARADYKLWVRVSKEAYDRIEAFQKKRSSTEAGMPDLNFREDKSAKKPKEGAKEGL